MPFGQVVIGPPGSGKTTYCNGAQQLLRAGQRRVAVVNLDPANDALPYEPDIDVSDLVCLESVMKELGLGPNGGALLWFVLGCLFVVARVFGATRAACLEPVGDGGGKSTHVLKRIQSTNNLPSFRPRVLLGVPRGQPGLAGRAPRAARGRGPLLHLRPPRAGEAEGRL